MRNTGRRRLRYKEQGEHRRLGYTGRLLNNLRMPFTSKSVDMHVSSARQLAYHVQCSPQAVQHGDFSLDIGQVRRLPLYGQIGHLQQLLDGLCCILFAALAVCDHSHNAKSAPSQDPLQAYTFRRSHQHSRTSRACIPCAYSPPMHLHGTTCRALVRPSHHNIGELLCGQLEVLLGAADGAALAMLPGTASRARGPRCPAGCPILHGKPLAWKGCVVQGSRL